MMETAEMTADRRLSSKNEVFKELGAVESIEEAVSDSVWSIVVVILAPRLVVVSITELVLSVRMSRIVDPSEEVIIVDLDSELTVSISVLGSLSVSVISVENVTSEGEIVVKFEEFGSTRAAK